MPNFNEINQSSARGPQYADPEYLIDEQALSLFSDGNEGNQTRLQAIAMNQAKMRMNLLKLDRSMRGTNTSRLSVSERRSSVKKNLQAIDAFIPPEVKLRQKQGHDYQKFVLRKQLEDEGSDMCITNVCVDSPFICCCFAYIILIAVTAAAFYLNYFEISDQNYREFALWDDPRIMDWDMQEAAKL